MKYITEQVSKDLDVLAKIYHPKWDKNIHYYKYLIKFIPPNCKTVLDIGCGSGEFSRMLSSKSEKVIAVDISSEMISLAKSKSEDYNNIEYQYANLFELKNSTERFDCVISIAMYHHYYLEDVLRKSLDLLKKGGVLIVLDVYDPKSLIDKLYSALAVIPFFILKLFKNRYIRDSKQIREIWRKHSKNDRIISFADVKKAAFRASATIYVRRLLFWRYLIVHKKNDDELFP